MIDEYQRELCATQKRIREIGRELNNLENNEENKDKINQLKEEQERLEKKERTTQAILDAYVKMASGIMHYRELKSMSPKTDAEKDALSEVLEQKEADIIEARRILPEELQEEIKNLWQGQTRKSQGEKEKTANKSNGNLEII